MEGDIELFDAWCDGDLSAGSTLFDRYYDSILRFFRNKVADSDAQDLVQQTFAACVEGRDRLREVSSFRAYLFSIAKNMFRVYVRTKSRSETIDFETQSLLDLGPGPQSLAAQRREQRLLLEGLRRIPIDSQILLELRYWERMKTVEIAEILEVPHGTVRSRLQRALGQLRRAVEGMATSVSEVHSTFDNLDKWVKECRAQLGNRM